MTKCDNFTVFAGLFDPTTKVLEAFTILKPATVVR
jgi:hypothetical protein